MKMNVYATSFSYEWVCTKTRCDAEAKTTRKWSINVVESKLQAHATRPNGSVGRSRGMPTCLILMRSNKFVPFYFLAL